MGNLGTYNLRWACEEGRGQSPGTEFQVDSNRIEYIAGYPAGVPENCLVAENPQTSGVRRCSAWQLRQSRGETEEGRLGIFFLKQLES